MQGDQGFPGETGLQGERGIGEPGPKVCTISMSTQTKLSIYYHIFNIIYVLCNSNRMVSWF